MLERIRKCTSVQAFQNHSNRMHARLARNGGTDVPCARRPIHHLGRCPHETRQGLHAGAGYFATWAESRNCNSRHNAIFERRHRSKGPSSAEVTDSLKCPQHLNACQGRTNSEFLPIRCLMADPIYANSKPFKAEHAYLVDAVRLKQPLSVDLGDCSRESSPPSTPQCRSPSNPLLPEQHRGPAS